MEFASEEQAAEATKKDRQRMGERWIEIYPSTHEEMRRREEATAALAAQYVTELIASFCDFFSIAAKCNHVLVYFYSVGRQPKFVRGK